MRLEPPEQNAVDERTRRFRSFEPNEAIEVHVDDDSVSDSEDSCGDVFGPCRTHVATSR